MEMVGANRTKAAQGLDPLETKTNYFIGSDPGNWHRNVPNFARVRYSEIYPGIDLIYYGKERRLEYDLLVAAGSDPNVIRLRYTGTESMRVDNDGALVLSVKGRQMRQLQPNAYQTIAGERRAVQASYRLNESEVQIALGNYDHSQALVIDPALIYSTYYGGTSDEQGFAIAVDGSGNAYLTGNTSSANLATAGAFQTALAGSTNAYVTELNPAGTAVVFATYLGGNTFDEGDAIAVDATGVYVGGTTASTNFPVTAGAPQSTLKAAAGNTNVFLAKLSANGQSLIYATYLGGGGNDFMNSVAVDGVGVVYATGSTMSGPTNLSGNPPSFPVTAGVVQSTFGGSNAPPGHGTGDVFLSKLSADGKTLLYSTYLGGSGDEEGWAVSIDSSGNAFVAGDSTTATQFPNPPSVGVIQPGPHAKISPARFNAFVTEINSTATALVFFTYLGGSGDDQLHGMTRDAAGNIYLTGSTTSADFPVSAGAAQTVFAGAAPFGDAYVAKINPTGSAISYATYLGGSGNDAGADVRVDSNGFAYVLGFTASTNFPVTASATQSALVGSENAFLTRLRPDGKLFVFSTYHGGAGFVTPQRMALDASNLVYFTGYTQSPFPTTAGVVQPAFGGGTTDAFAVKFDASVPVSDLMPTSLTFGNQRVNTSSATQNVTLTNIGNQPLVITSITASAGFSQINTCGTLPGATLAPAANCTITVTFTPTANGPITGTITIVDNAAGSPRTVPLTGTGTSPTASLTPSATVTFGGQNVGTTSASQTVTLTNTGTDMLNISNISALGGTNPGDFTSANTCGTTLAPSATCTFSFAFAPLNVGARSATLTITSDSGGVAGTPTTITLNGTGTTPVGGTFLLSSSMSTLTVHPGQTAVFPITITPINGFNQAVTLTCTGAPPLANCSMVPGSVTLDGVNASSASAQVATKAGSMLLPRPAPRTDDRNGAPPWLWVLLATIIALLSSRLGMKTANAPMRGRYLGPAALLLLIVGLTIFASACGDSGKPGTPSGTYTLTVTGTGAGQTQSTNLTLTVQ
jgi:hypothetical protein